MVPVPTLGLRWEHEEKTLEVAQVAKAVRLMATLRGALALADMRLTTEACSLLRLAGDLSMEILFVCEGIKGPMTEDHRLFLEQFFASPPMSPEELERVRWVGRPAVARALARLFGPTGVNVEDDAKKRAYLAAIYDRYVHGKYATAMELFSGETMNFMLGGSDDPGHVHEVKIAVAGKTVEAIQALQMMAVMRRLSLMDIDMTSTAFAVNQERAGL